MAGESIDISWYTPAADDPLASAHDAVTGFYHEAFAAIPDNQWFRDIEPKSLSSGAGMLKQPLSELRRFVLAIFAQQDFWEALRDRIFNDAAANEAFKKNLGWEKLPFLLRQRDALLNAILRRAIPFTREDIPAILRWSCRVDLRMSLSTVNAATKAVARYLESSAADEEIDKLLKQLAHRLRKYDDPAAKRQARLVELMRGTPAASAAKSQDVRPVKPALAGDAKIARRLKQELGLLPGGEAAAQAVETTGIDSFALAGDSPLRVEHLLLTELFAELRSRNQCHSPALKPFESGRKILEMDEKARGRVLLAATERDFAARIRGEETDWFLRNQDPKSAAEGVANILLQSNVELDRAGVFDVVLYLAACSEDIVRRCHWLIDRVEREASNALLSEGERYALFLYRAAFVSGSTFGGLHPAVERLTKLTGDGAMFVVVPGEAASDAINSDISAMAEPTRSAWVRLFQHLVTATATRPSEKWLAAAKKLVAPIGTDAVLRAFVKWIDLIRAPRTLKRFADPFEPENVIHVENVNAFRGIFWTLPILSSGAEAARDSARIVGAAAVSAYRKVPGIGPRAIKVGNAAIYCLSELKSSDAVGQLAMLKVRVKSGSAQKEIEKAFLSAAEALGMSREDIEELGVPSYGLEDVGIRREKFGDDFSAEVRVDGREVTLTWLRADGKPQKSVPASVKSQFKDELKELQSSVKDIGAMLPAQCERLDSTFLLQKRWTVAAWRERYIDHPLVGTIARRLIWSFTNAGENRTEKQMGKQAVKQTGAGIWLDGKIVGIDSEPLTISDDASVELWHPIGMSSDDVVAWRDFLQRHEIRQPFKQAHREVYLLTDAERNTQTYSNRFAAHILRQHQFNALCAARRWKHRLRMAVDDYYPPPMRLLTNWNLRAEFWVEAVRDVENIDVTDSGAYRYLATDQVRFHHANAAEHLGHAAGGGYASEAVGPGTNNLNAPVPLEQIPPLVFSEIMRDVDLFVGVASMGNDPTWQDGGPGGRFADYWQSVSFGGLTASAQTRRDVLQSLLPRLTKIRDRCTLVDRFLVVRGDIRTYKIHLGSGNILMEPNDKYLCIVPDSSSARKSDEVFLPFEGDGMLAIILSKALLLADDAKISDRSILRQIKD